MKKRKNGSKILETNSLNQVVRAKDKPEAPPARRHPPGARGSGLTGSGNWGSLQHFIIFLAAGSKYSTIHLRITFCQSCSLGAAAAQPARGGAAHEQH